MESEFHLEIVDPRQPANSLPRLLTLLEVAELLRLSPHTVRSMIRKGRLEPLRICRRLLFDPKEILRILERAGESRPIDQASRDGK